MFTKAKESKTPKYILLTALIVLAVIISMAAAGKANAAESEIKSIEYKPAKTKIVYSTSDIYLDGYYDDDGITVFDQFYPLCAVWDTRYLRRNSLDDFEAISEGSEDYLISSNDKLIITREDGTVQTLSPRYNLYFDIDLWDARLYNIAWFDENNKITDVATEFSWSNKPVLYTDEIFGRQAYKAGTYDNTVTVKVGDKSTTFKKKLIIKGSSSSSYDKKVPVVSNKKVKSGYKKSYKKNKNTVIVGFWMSWPKIKGAHSYEVKLTQIYPESYKSSRYITQNMKFKDVGNIIGSSRFENTEFPTVAQRYEPTGDMLDIAVTHLTADTMIEQSVRVVKKSNPKKTGAHYVYGKFSKPARFFCSKNKTLKAKGKKKSVRLTWDKVYRASGYTIKYSTKKNMSKAKTIKVKGENKKAYTIKKLKKNKKYYFQIMPYKVYKGKTYTGYISAKKAAKTK